MPIQSKMHGKENHYVNTDGEKRVSQISFDKLGLFLVNLVLVVAIQCAFFHTNSAPLTADRLEQLPYFQGCKILDIRGTEVDADALRGKADPNWILFADSKGNVVSVRVEWNLYVPRFRIQEETAHHIPMDAQRYSFVEKDFLGENEIVVENQNTYGSIVQSGLFRQQTTIQFFHVLAAIGLLLLEELVSFGFMKLAGKKK